MFFAKDGALHTPTPDCFLNGITRQTVIELAKRRGIKVVERTILPEELGSFSEVFITGTAAEITPVREIGQHSYTPGKLCELLLNDYMAEVQPKSRAAAE
jgi:branched-chain amino acid aminotransferase